MTKRIRKFNVILTCFIIFALLFFAVVKLDGVSVYADDGVVENEKLEITEPFENVFGASVRCTSPNGIRFKVAMTAEKKQEIFAENSGKELGLFIFPADNLEANKDNYANLAKKVQVKFVESDLYQVDGLWCANGVMSNIYLQNFNREFIGVGYIATTKGETVTYEYSKFIEADNVRSMSQVSLAAYLDKEASEEIKTATFGLVEKGVYGSYGLIESRTKVEDEVVSTYTLGETVYTSYEEMKESNPIKISTNVANNQMLFVEETYELSPYLSINGTNAGFVVPFNYVSSNSSVISVDENGTVTVNGCGEATLTVSFGSYSTSITVTSAVPVRTEQDFLAIGTNNTTMAMDYILMNDIDFKGATVNAFSSYDSRNTQSFTGTFDGNGYSLMNLKLAKSNVVGSGNDISLFGYMNNENAVIKNLSVLNVTLDGKGGVISSWANRGTIENCYVEVTVTGTNNVSSQNDIGAFIWRCQQPVTIKNCISVVTVEEGVATTYVGGVVGMHLGTMQNCQAIVLSGNALKVFTSEHTSVKGSVEGSAVYTSVDGFYSGVATTAYDDVWVFNNGYLPHLDKMTKANVPVAITAENEVYAGSSLEVSATNATLALKEDIEGVEIVNGILTVDNSVEGGTLITLVATSYYFADVSVEYNVSVIGNSYEITAEQNSFTFAKAIQGVTTKSTGITVTLNGEPTTEGYVIASNNEDVVTVSNNELTVKGVGEANIEVLVDGFVIFSLPVTVGEVYTPVYNATDLSNIAKNLKGKYILMNHIDFKGAEFAAIGTQKVATSAFAGVFDGNGYSIQNIKPVKSTVSGASNDRSIFGYLNGATIKNLSVTGAEIDGFGGVLGTLVAASTIENCYVQVTVTGTETNGGVQGGKYGEEIGALVWRTQANTTIKNCITNVTVKEGLTTTYIGAIVGMHIGTMQNCQAIVTGATFDKTYASVHSTTAFKEVSNSAVYTTPDAFYEDVDETTAYDANVWAFDATSGTIALKKGCSDVE